MFSGRSKENIGKKRANAMHILDEPNLWNCHRSNENLSELISWDKKILQKTTCGGRDLSSWQNIVDLKFIYNYIVRIHLLKCSMKRWKVVQTQGGTLLFQKYCFTCFNDSPLKMIKDAFYFILKTFFILKIFKLLSGIFGYTEITAWLER